MTDELDALATRAMVIDPLLEVDFDTQRDVEQDPYGAREAIETALFLIRDQTAAITTLRAQLAEARAAAFSREKEWADIAGEERTRTALQSAIRAAKVEAWREAAGVIAYMPGSRLHKPIMKPWRDAILALIEREGGDGCSQPK